MKQQLQNKEQEVFYEVEYLQNQGFLYSNWIGSYLSFEQIKQGCLLGLDKVKEHKCPLLLNDNRQLEGTWDEANEWIATEWMPQAIQAGLMKFAHILPEDIYAQLSAEFMEDNAKEVENVFQLKMFNNQEDAEKWLLQD